MIPASKIVNESFIQEVLHNWKLFSFKSKYMGSPQGTTNFSAPLGNFLCPFNMTKFYRNMCIGFEVANFLFQV
jgi:hypothetical protein